MYKVSDESGQVFALKRILLADKKAAEAARREVQFLREIPRHRALVELVGAEVSSKEALLLFEYCGGGSVYSLIERRLEQQRPLGEEEVWAVYHAACEAVEHLHTQTPPIIHRDLKVENLLLAKRGVVLCDFGSATTHVYNTQSAAERRAAEDDINNNTTMSYRSPEMADLFCGKRISEKSDVWALGVLLYRLAYFEPPWEADSSLGILNCKYRIPHNRCSDALPSLIKSLLILDPNKRPDIYFVLERVLAVRGKTMSATMAQRRDAYRQRAQQLSVSAPSVPSAGASSSSGGAAGSSAVAVDGGGFVAASLFGQLDWQDADGSSSSSSSSTRQQPSRQSQSAPSPQQQQYQQQQYQQQQQQPAFFQNAFTAPQPQQTAPSSQAAMFPVSFEQFAPQPSPAAVRLTPPSNAQQSPAPQRLSSAATSQSNVSPLFEQHFSQPSAAVRQAPLVPFFETSFQVANPAPLRQSPPLQQQANVSPLFEQAFMAPAQPQQLQQRQAASFSAGPNSPAQQRFAAPHPVAQQSAAAPRFQQQPSFSPQNSPAMSRGPAQGHNNHQGQPSFGSFAGATQQQQPFFADFSKAAGSSQQQQQQQYHPTLHAMPNQAPAKSLDDLFK